MTIEKYDNATYLREKINVLEKVIKELESVDENDNNKVFFEVDLEYSTVITSKIPKENLRPSDLKQRVYLSDRMLDALKEAARNELRIFKEEFAQL